MTTISLGRANKESANIDLDILLRTRLLIQANSGGGKSWLLRRLAEQAFGKVQVIIIDPEGEFATLREKFGYVLVGKGGETPADVRSAALVAHKLLELHANAVCDLYEVKASARHAWVRLFLEAMVDAPKTLWHPVLVIVDEAHIFCPEKGQGESEASDAMIGLATRGRKRGFCAVWATQRLSKLSKNATSELLNRLVGPTFEDIDLDRAAGLLSVMPSDRAKFFEEMKTLEPGRFYGFGRAIAKRRVLIEIGAVATTHPELGQAASVEPPAPPEKIKKLLPSLADLPQMAEAKVKQESELRAEIADLKRQLATRPVGEVKVETVQVLDPGQVGVLRIQVEALDVMLKRQVEAMAAHKSAITNAVQPIAKALDAAGKTGAGRRPHLAPARPIYPQGKTAAPGQLNLAPTPTDRPRKQQAILDVLSWLEHVGVDEALRTQVALLTDQSPTSSAYGNNLGALRSAGLIAYPSPAMVWLTPAGRVEAHPSSIAPTTDGLQATLLARLPKKQAAILRELINRYPRAIDKNELAEATEQSATSSAYGNNLGALRSLGVIDYPQPGQAVALPVLFLEA